jgi:protein gp37
VGFTSSRVFDNEVPPEWRADLWDVIRATPLLRWMLLTKRIGNVLKMVPPDWPSTHVGIMATIVNQAELHARRAYGSMIRPKAALMTASVRVAAPSLLRALSR